MLNVFVYGAPALFSLGIVFLIAVKLHPCLTDTNEANRSLTRQEFIYCATWGALSCCAVNGAIFAMFFGTEFFESFVEERPTYLLNTIYYASFINLYLSTPLFYQCQIAIWVTGFRNSTFLKSRTKLVFSSWFLGGLYCSLVYVVVALLFVLPMFEILIIEPPPRESFALGLFDIGSLFSTLSYSAIIGFAGLCWSIWKLPQRPQDSHRRHKSETRSYSNRL